MLSVRKEKGIYRMPETEKRKESVKNEGIKLEHFTYYIKRRKIT